MQYSPKLKKAMDQIKSILKEHDIAGFVLLHEPGFIEYLNHVNPSYSCASLSNEGEFRVKLKTSELPGGRVQAKQLAEDTFNMVTLMTDVLAMHASGYIDFQKMLADRWGGEEGPASHTSHNKQNN